MWGRSLWLALPLILSSSALAEDLLVPDEYPTIQAAIDAAEDGDRVMAQPVTYEESISSDEPLC